ncbi:MAG: isochorismatase family protein [Bacillota bacterium]|nr:isochorismatase family protein [Bacillota bacterium]
MIGKVSDEFFRRHILPHLGASSPLLEVKPQMGVDAAVLRVGEQYLVVAEDPIFPAPGLPLESFGWFTVHIGASDVAVLGVKPQFLSYSLLLPPGTPEEDVAAIVRSISAACRELDIAIVGGHTGYYPAVTVPTIGGVTVFALADRVISPAGARPGDRLLLTKGAAVEAAGLLAAVFGEEMRQAGISEETVCEAAAQVYQMSVVKDALTAAAAGGVHAMHDATEGGVLRGVYEMAEAAGLGVRLDLARVPISPATAATCRYFGIDPLAAISEGTLVLAVAPESVADVLSALRRAKITAAEVGVFLPAAEGKVVVRADGSSAPLFPPEVDPFWEVFFRRLGAAPEATGPGGAERGAYPAPVSPGTPAGASSSEGADTATPAGVLANLRAAAQRLVQGPIAHLIPEVQSNLLMALPGARTADEVAAFPGRLVRYKNEVRVLGEPEFGASRYMARVVLAALSRRPDLRAAMNIRYSEEVIAACQELGFAVASFERADEPEEFRRNPAYASLEWGTLHAIDEALSQGRPVPEVIYDRGGWRLEPVVRVLGRDALEVAEKVLAIARRTALPAPGPEDALIVVDVQNDFCPGGALAVPEGDRVVPALNRWIEAFRAAGRPVAYTQDWHPAGHCSFQSQGGPWPAHCVQGTAGAALHPALRVEGTLFRKGFLPEKEAYSGFQAYRAEGDGVGSQPLAEWLKGHGVRRVFIGGLATDYCVRATAEDALAEGLEVFLLREGMRAVDVRPGDGERALQELEERGARVI